MSYETVDTDVLVIGAGGGVRAGRRPLSMMLARLKAEFIIESGAEAVITECSFFLFLA